MKRIATIFLCIIILTAVFAGCEKSDRNSETTETTTVEPQTMEIESTYNEKSRTMRTVYRNSDGEISSISVVTYNEKNKVVKESTYDENDALESMVTYDYDEDMNIIEMQVFDENSKLSYMYKDYEYKKVKTENGEKFILLKHNRYNSEGKVDMIFKWEYDENNNCVSMSTYSSDGALLTKNEL